MQLYGCLPGFVESYYNIILFYTAVVNAAPGPDISGFLDDKKSVLDRDSEICTLDNVRYYAYEGDGNTSGSLSSLASCKYLINTVHYSKDSFQSYP